MELFKSLYEEFCAYIKVGDYMKNKIIIYAVLVLFLCSTAFGQKLSPAQQISDFDDLCSKLESVHPDLYLYQSKKEYENNKMKIKASMTDSIKISDFYFKIAPFIANIKDGHSMMLPPITSDFVSYVKKDGKTMPLRIKAVENVFVVDYPIVMNSGFNEGDTIFSINGVDSKDILKKAYDLWGSEKDNGIKEAAVNTYLSLLFWHMYRWDDSYVFMVKHGNTIEKKHLEGVPQSMAMKVRRERLSKNKPESFSCKFSSDYTQATLIIRNVYNEKALKEFCDSVFKEINYRKIPEIIIDMRNNTGGSSQCVERLISYFPHPEYVLYSKSQIKVSTYSKAYNKERHPEIYSQICNIPDGELFVVKESLIEDNRKEANLYRGKIIVLVNNKTYSGASSFAHVMNKLGIASVEGETGCPTVYFGNFLPFTLPNSKIDYYITFAKFYE
jgi:C-terminal processing protease CtpA/Prc